MRAYRVLIPFVALLAACSDPSAKSKAQIPQLVQPTRAAPGDSMTMKMSFAPVVKRAAPAVVNISSKRLVRQQSDPFWQMFGMGAPRERIELMRLTARIAREQSIGVLFTEHDMDAVFAHAHRILVLVRGEIIARGSPDEVRADPEVQRVYLGHSGTRAAGRAKRATHD